MEVAGALQSRSRKGNPELSSFLDYPPELRNLVYESLLISKRMAPLGKFGMSAFIRVLDKTQEELPVQPTLTWPPSLPVYLSILITCRQIYREASPIYYGRHIFDFGDPFYLKLTRTKIPTEPLPRLCKIRHLRLDDCHSRELPDMINLMAEWGQHLSLQELTLPWIESREHFTPLRMSNIVLPLLRAMKKGYGPDRDPVQILNFGLPVTVFPQNKVRSENQALQNNLQVKERVWRNLEIEGHTEWLDALRRQLKARGFHDQAVINRPPKRNQHTEFQLLLEQLRSLED